MLLPRERADACAVFPLGSRCPFFFFKRLSLRLFLLYILDHRLLHQRVDWTKCVFAASTEAVEAENLFFVLGGPTSYMALSGERSAPTLRPRKQNYEALQLRASTRPHAARVKFKSLTPLTMTPKVSIG